MIGPMISSHRARDFTLSGPGIAVRRRGRGRRAGMDVEFEHGAHDPQTDVTHDDPIVTGKIAFAHMKEFPDYYERLERMEEEAKRDWAARGVSRPA